MVRFQVVRLSEGMDEGMNEAVIESQLVDDRECDESAN